MADDVLSSAGVLDDSPPPTSWVVTSPRSTYPVALLDDPWPTVSDLIGDHKGLLVTTSEIVDLGIVSSGRFGGLEMVVLADGEAAKCYQSVEQIFGQLAGLGFGNADFIIALGGGSLTDTAGFAAATWRRGCQWVAVPTTISGAVDAAVGGKTAINTSCGKNTMGVLWDPAGVFVDMSALELLGSKQISLGMAEVIKVALTHQLATLPVLATELGDGSCLPWTLLRGATEVAVAVASGDFGPGRNPDVLSYGHEVAHALEQASGLTIAHGDAVAIGLVFTCLIEEQLGWGGDVVGLSRALRAAGLPSLLGDLGCEYKWSTIAELLAHDKRMGGSLKFLAVDRRGVPVVRWTPDLGDNQCRHLWASLSG
jgi:3-dehydroquinate synthetase